MEYKHRDVTITFNAPGGNFLATVNGEHINAPSLPAIKKQIDSRLAKKFESFKAFAVSDRTKIFTVLRVEKAIGHRRGSREKQFVTDSEGWLRRQYNVVLATPENKKLVSEYFEFLNATRAQIKLLEEQIDVKQRAIPELSAEDYDAVKP